MENMDFKTYLLEKEEPEKHAVFAFGRMNPPTTGHEKLVDAVHQIAKAHKAEHLLVVSHSHDSKKNPLDSETKLKHVKRFFPKTNVTVSSKEHPNFLEHAALLHKQGVTHLHMVAGSDRVEDYKERLNKYNGEGEGKLFHFKQITVHSSGERDPDAEGTAGMSASKMREHAKSSNFKEFRKGVPSHIKDTHAKELYNDVRKGMALKEESDSRQRYVNGEIFTLGETVYVQEGQGEIVYRGPNYATVRLNENVAIKKWIHDLNEQPCGEPRMDSFKTSVKKGPKVPAILMPKAKQRQMSEAANQITYNGYTTENLDMCADAKKQFDEIIKRTDLNPEYIMKALQATDYYLGVEKQAVKDGWADHEAVHQFLMKLSIAHDVLNMMGYPDKELEYMKGHIQQMSKLSMHRDGSFANEYGTHEPVVGTSFEESVRSADVKQIEFVGADGKTIKRKIKAKTIISDKDDEDDSEDKEMKEAKSFKAFRKPVVNTAPQQQVDVTDDDNRRDVNYSPDKDVFFGIDKPELGMFSFKSFMLDTENKKVADAYEKDKEDVQAAAVQHTQHSPSYHQMRKSKQQLDV